VDEKYCYSSSVEDYLSSFDYNANVLNSSSSANFANNTFGNNNTVLCTSSYFGTRVAVMCDGRVQCDNKMDECSTQCGSDLPLFCTTDLSCLLTSEYICDGVWQSDEDCGGRIDAEELECPESSRFYCQSGPTISIAVDQVRQFTFCGRKKMSICVMTLHSYLILVF